MTELPDGLVRFAAPKTFRDCPDFPRDREYSDESCDIWCGGVGSDEPELFLHDLLDEVLTNVA